MMGEARVEIQVVETSKSSKSLSQGSGECVTPKGAEHPSDDAQGQSQHPPNPPFAAYFRHPPDFPTSAARRVKEEHVWST